MAKQYGTRPQRLAGRAGARKSIALQTSRSMQTAPASLGRDLHDPGSRFSLMFSESSGRDRQQEAVDFEDAVAALDEAIDSGAKAAQVFLRRPSRLGGSQPHFRIAAYMKPQGFQYATPEVREAFREARHKGTSGHGSR